MGPRRRLREVPAPRTWWVRQGEDVQGPFSLKRMRAWRATGKLQAEMEVSHDQVTWERAGDVRALRPRRGRVGSTRTRGWEFHRVMRAYTPDTHATYVLLGLNVLVYVLMILGGVSAFSPTAQQLLDWGGDYGPRTTCGEWWRLLSSTFVHGGFVHLFGNMLFFWYIGRFMERLLGQAGYVVLYLGSGVLASLVSQVVSPAVVSVGASGAIFGLFGGVLGFVARRDRDPVAQGALRSVKLAAIAFIVFQVLFSLGDSHVNHGAHAGGALGGFALAWMLAHPLTEAGVARRKQRAVFAGAAVVAVLVPVALLLPRYADVPAFMESFGRIEQRLLSSYRRGLAGEVSSEAFAEEIDGELVPRWEDLLGRTRALRPVPGRFAAVVPAMERYAERRLAALRVRRACLETRSAEAARKEARRRADAADVEALRALQELAQVVRELD